MSPKPTFHKLGPQSFVFITVFIVSDNIPVIGLEKRDKQALKSQTWKRMRGTIIVLWMQLSIHAGGWPLAIAVLLR